MKITRVKKKTLLLFPLIVSSALAVVFCFGCSEATPPKESSKESSKPARRDNIILISADTLRADHLGCYGYARNTSPNIDEFVKESVFFERAATQAPHTAPAHMSIFTALTPAVHGVKNHLREKGSYNRLNDSVLTLTEILKKNGYMTAGFTGGGNIAGHLGFDKGFDEYSKSILWKRVQKDPGQLDEIRKWIRLSRESEQPLFLFLHNHICHDPYVSAPEEFRFAFLEKRVEGLPVSLDDIGGEGGFENKDDVFWKNVDFENPEHIEHMVGLYDGCISYMDYVFGETIKVLKEEGIFDDSIIVFLSDHGEEFYEHRTIRHGYLFVETMHVPLIVRFPGGEFAGNRIGNSVRTMDLMPTLFEFLGIDANQFTQGSSFMPLLTGKGEYDPVILSYDGDLEAVRLHKDGFIYSNQATLDALEWLFDEESDPKETQNLAGSKIRTLLRMRAAAERIKKSDMALAEKYGTGDGEIREADKETLKQLKNLGYLQ